MSETSGKCDRKNSRTSRSGTSSRALVAGPSLFDWLDGQTNGQFSRDHVPALPFPQPEKRKRAPSAKAAKLSRIRTRLESLLASGAAMNGLPMGGTCGPSCGESSGDSDRRLRWESRLRERMELYGSVEYGLRWNTLATPLGEPILQRRALGHRTSGNDCFGWPTAPENDSRGGRNRTAVRSNPNSTHKDGMTLVDTADMTPAGWCPPACRDAKDAACMDADVPVNTLLGRQATMLVASTMPGVTQSQFSAEMGNTVECPRLMLNPAFSGWLMGYPLEWVTAGRRAMEAVKSRKRSTRSRRRKPDESDS